MREYSRNIWVTYTARRQNKKSINADHKYLFRINALQGPFEFCYENYCAGAVIRIIVQVSSYKLLCRCGHKNGCARIIWPDNVNNKTKHMPFWKLFQYINIQGKSLVKTQVRVLVVYTQVRVFNDLHGRR